MSAIDNAAVCRSLADIQREEQRRAMRLQRKFARDNAERIAAEWDALPDWQSPAERARNHLASLPLERRVMLAKEWL